MFEKSSASKRMDQFIWTCVGLFISCYTCWHFKLLPSLDQIQATVSGNYHTVVAEVKSQNNSVMDHGSIPGNTKEMKSAAEPVPPQIDLPSESNNDFNSVWQKFSQDEKVNFKPAKKTPPKQTPSIESELSSVQIVNSEPVLIPTPARQNFAAKNIEPFNQFMELSEPADQRVSPALHQEPKTPININPWAEQSTSEWETDSGTKTISHQQPEKNQDMGSNQQLRVVRTTPHYNDVIQNNLSYNPERNNVRMELIPGHAENSQQDEVRFVKNEEPAKSAVLNQEAQGHPLQKLNDEQLLLQQPIKTGIENPSKTSSNNPQDEVLRLREISQVYWNQPSQRAGVEREINILAKKIFFEKNVHYLPAYKIAPGDQLTKIAKKYDVPWEYLARLNQVNPARIKAGDTLKVQQGPFSALVDLSDFELTIHSRGYYVCKFIVGTGKNGASPLGTFKVKNKEVNPVYYGPEKVIERDDPANPLGERWIDIGNSFGIHGTNEPDSIGKAESKGCIRMKNVDVELVYDLLIIGSEVTIRE